MTSQLLDHHRKQENKHILTQYSFFSNLTVQQYTFYNFLMMLSYVYQKVYNKINAELHLQAIYHQ